MSSSHPPRATSRRLLFSAFAALAVSCLLVTGFAFSQAWVLEQRASFLVEHAVNSSRLLSRMDHDLEHERILTLAHIGETRAKDMSNIGAEIARVDGDLSQAEREYRPWLLQQGERTMWESARADLAGARASMARALELSASNRDDEARVALEEAGARFRRISRTFGELIAFNDRESASVLAGIAAIRIRLLLSFAGVGLTLLLHIWLVGRWSMREVAQREEEMALHSRALEARNRELDAFAGRVAHDLRGPLMAINLAAARLARAPHEAAALEPLGRGIRRMQTLIDDLLALARVEYERGSCEPTSLASQLRADFAERIEGERGSLRIDMGQARVGCSEGLLRQALCNLVENAVKYRRPEVAPQVEVLGAPAEDRYALRVRDNGIGMTTEEAARVFEPFFRAQQVRGLPGTGLGLSIVKRVVDACGGSIRVASRPGQGTSFELELPLAPKAQESAKELPSQPPREAEAPAVSSVENP